MVLGPSKNSRFDFVLRKGMKLKDLPECVRSAFTAPYCPEAQPEFRFRDGRFYKLTYIVWEVFEGEILDGSKLTVCLSTWNIKVQSAALTAKEQIRMAEIAMRPCKIEQEAWRTISRRARSLVWC